MLSSPGYDSSDVHFKIDRAEYLESCAQKIAASLASVVKSGVITTRDAEAIAERITEFIEISTYGTFGEYSAYARRMGREAIGGSHEVPDDANRYWLLRTTWAKNRPLKFDAVESRVLYSRGMAEFDRMSYRYDSAGPVRPLRGGGGLFSEDMRHSLIEVEIPAEPVSIDGKQTFPARIGFLIANDGPGRAWDLYMVLIRGVPADVVVAMPPP